MASADGQRRDLLRDTKLGRRTHRQEISINQDVFDKYHFKIGILRDIACAM